MRRRLLPFCLALAGCAGASTPSPDSDAPRRAEEACAVAVAAHIGKRPDAVEVRWTGTGPDGLARLEARDDGRLHACTLDTAGRVLRIDHV